jgi:hypothetical protein
MTLETIWQTCFYRQTIEFLFNDMSKGRVAKVVGQSSSFGDVWVDPSELVRAERCRLRLACFATTRNAAASSGVQTFDTAPVWLSGACGSAFRRSLGPASSNRVGDRRAPHSFTRARGQP